MAETVRVANISGTEWEITLDPDNWATAHHERLIASGDLKVIGSAKPVRKAKTTAVKKEPSDG